MFTKKRIPKRITEGKRYAIATIYRTDGNSIQVAYPPNRRPHLRDMQAVVGGYIECFERNVESEAYCNEDGIALGLPPNPFFSGILGNVVTLSGFEEDDGSATETDNSGLLEKATLSPLV
jgi:hypothetical protein